MPELPEITVIANQMDSEITGKHVANIDVKQPKILNMPTQAFINATRGKVLTAVTSRGKWILAELGSSHLLLLNLGMGADLRYFSQPQGIPENTQFRLSFTDGTGFTIRFWWFGYVHLVPKTSLQEHKLTAGLGISPIDEKLTLERFEALLARKRTGAKSFILDQKNIAGIGNVYVHDILFKAGVHPNRKTSTLSKKQIDGLYEAMRSILTRSIQLGGLAYETDFHGRKGRFTADEFLVGYKDGKPCPVCGSTIEKIRTGSTSSYICPRCQPAT